jgi:hypothetical protein
MLNELYTLDRSLKRFRVSVTESHKWVKRLGRSALLIAGVDASGVVAEIGTMDAQEAVSLFKIQPSNQANFPQVNWNGPIWNLDRKSAAVQEWLACPDKEVGRRAELLRRACTGADIAPGQCRAVTRMREFCRELAERFPRDDDSEFGAFPVLLSRLLGAALTPEEWLRRLSDTAISSAETGPPELLASVEVLLAGEDAKVPILFDLADCTDFRCRVANARMGGYFSKRLNATEEAGTTMGRCALSGLEMPLETEKMPSPNLPVLGPTFLMAMNPDTPCQTRYKRIGTDIFPVGKTTAAELNTALVHLTTAAREGKNWKRIPGNNRKKFHLLVVYLETSPLLEAEIAEMFTGSEKSDRVYSAICEEVCKALEGRKAADSDLLHVFTLNKIDPGRVQVEFSDSFTASQAVQGSAEWRAGARNRPLLPLTDDEGVVPSPIEVMRCVQMSWERSGASYCEAPGCRLADVFDLLIAGRPGAEVSARGLLAMTLRRTTDLLVAVGHAAHRGTKEAWKGISREAGKYPVIAASLLGITLNKLGQPKENYMHEPAFLIGRFLSLADTLHAEYCKVARKNDMPPQLLGNALIPTAIHDANKALARMLLRIRPYQAWAKGKSGTGLARWSCGEMGKIATEVESKLGSVRFNDAQQAQLLLGYLARTEAKEENKTEEGATN